MADDSERLLFSTLRSIQDKYTYFLLAAAGAAIGLALTQTKGLSLNWSQFPLGLAVLNWGLSFFFGCRQLTSVSSGLYANAGLIKIQK